MIESLEVGRSGLLEAADRFERITDEEITQ